MTGTWHRCRSALLAMLTVLAVSMVSGADAPAPWRWEPTLVPKALVIEGLWSEYFRVDAALHAAGLPYLAAPLSWLPPLATELPRRSVVVLVNVDAPALGPERLQQLHQFVANGGGLVVLGGYWAYTRGAYAGTPLAAMLPATFPPEFWIMPVRAGLPLTRAATASWTLPDFAGQPAAFHVQTLTPKPESVVQVLAGNRPAIISGAFGQGRVVAVALTVNGDPPAGTTAFWDWPQWPQVLGQACDWAAAPRPLAVPAQAAGGPPPLTAAEVEQLVLGLGVTDQLIRRACVRPTAEVAQALLDQLLAGREAHGDLTAAPDDVPGAGGVRDRALAPLLPALLPFAKPEWAPRVEPLARRELQREERQAALVLLGATRWPGARRALLEALPDPHLQLAALEGLGLSGDAAVRPRLREVFAAAIRAAEVPGLPGRYEPGVFAHEQAGVAAEAALALYRLGDEDGISRLLEMHRQVLLYWRIFHNAGRRRVAETDLQGQEIRRQLWSGAARLQAALEHLRRGATPVPPAQLPALLKVAQTTTDPVDVAWLAGMIESSATLPPATWQPLTTAKDRIIARLAEAAAGRQ